MNKLLTKILSITLLGFLCLVLGCEQQPAVGGLENNPLYDFVGKSYKSDYNEVFSITKQNDSIIVSHDGFGDGIDKTDTVGSIVSHRSCENGILYLVKCSSHSNWGQYQYPDYNEENPHSNCYTILYVRSLTEDSCQWGFFFTPIDGKDTACFSTFAEALPYLDYSKGSWEYLSEGAKI